MKTKIKKLGQVYTPKWIVNQILDMLLYNNESILDKYILEPSCGNGVFLEEILNRYINISLKNNIDKKDIIKNLEKYIYAIEIDYDEYNKTLFNLNNIIKERLGDGFNVNWNIFNTDTTLQYKEFIGFFDFIVGNPPYIRVHNIDDDTKISLKEEFTFSNGSLNMYIIFFEMGIKMLKENGKLGYITPNTYFYNVTHKNFRKYLKDNNLVKSIIDFKSNKIFKDFSTYTAITILSKNNFKKSFDYYEMVDNDIVLINNIFFNNLNNKKWIFLNNTNNDFIDNLINDRINTVSDFFDVKYGFATLRDKIFISKIIENDDNTVYFNNFLIEKGLLNKIIKVSKFKGDINNVEYVIFPYYLEDGRYKVIKEDDLLKNYPLTYNYLLLNKEELLKRDIENGLCWYEFGRSQGIQTMNNEKVVVNPMMTDKLIYFKIPHDIFVYSGIFIIKNKTYSDWNMIENILDSEELNKFIKITGKNLSGGFKSVTSKQIKEYKFNLL